MFVRLKRTATSFAAMVAVFWVYRLIAEPLIEPPVVEKRVAAATPEERAATQQKRQNRLGVYARFFPEGSWERDNPIMLENGNSKVLLKEYNNHPDGQVDLNPCTVIHLPDGETDGADNRRVIIMQAPQGAVLQFDGPVDLNQTGNARLLGGKLNGPVTIQSGPTKPEGGDDFLVTTHDVVLDENVISTPNPVDFRFGASVGHGRELRIVLAPSTEPTGKHRGPSFGGVQTIQLLHDVEMHLQTGSAGFLPGDQPQNYATVAPGTNSKAGGGNRSGPPVDIRCQGPFEFDPVLNVATFHESVTALRPNPKGAGPEDQLDCERLSVFFAPREEPKDSAKDTAAKDIAAKAEGNGNAKSNSTNGGTPRLEPKKFEAEGNPVIIRAPSNSLEAQARMISYQPDAADRWLGDMDSKGPGWLTIASPSDPTSRFEARWSQEMKMRPQEENHVVSVIGDALVRSTRQGELRANAIHMWLFETPLEKLAANGAQSGLGGRGNASNDASARIHPVKMMAEGNVQIESPELSGNVKRLETWFRDIAVAPMGNRFSVGGAPQRGDRHGSPLGFQPPDPQNPAVRRTHYEIKQGDLLQTKMGYLPRSAVEQASAPLEEATITGNVWFVETPTAQTQEQPLDIHGDKLHLEHADTNPQVSVFGRPAQVVARGMTLVGQNVQLDRGANRLWIDGVGQMTIADDQPTAANNRTAPKADQSGDLFAGHGTRVIDWQGRMLFDGRTARFERDVVARQIEPEQTQTVRTPLLEATFERPIDFNAPRLPQRAGERPQIELLFCHGDVWLERRETKNGNLSALDRLDRICDLRINRITGELNAVVAGPEPGRFVSWSYGSPMQLSNRPAVGTAGNRAKNPVGPASFTDVSRQARPRPVMNGAPPGEIGDAVEAKQINYSYVQFQQGITGNVLPDRRELTFRDQVRSIFGPVPTWDSQLDVDVQELAPGDVSMSCEQLTVNREVNAPNDNSSGEMTASGNTLIEGRQPEGDAFTARAPSVKYVRSKKMLVLSGEGRNFAHLDSQSQMGGAVQHLTAGEIQYWPETRSTIVAKPQIDYSAPAANPSPSRGGSKPATPSSAMPPGMQMHP
jgi:hypothetical protein